MYVMVIFIHKLLMDDSLKQVLTDIELQESDNFLQGMCT